MHELGMIQSVIDTVVTQAHEHGVEKITFIKLLVGKLTGANAKALEFGFDALKIKTKLAEAELEIIEIEPVFTCNSCGRVFSSDGWSFCCEKCGSHSLKVIKGEELLLDSFEGI
ncbi:MAG: hydrogenase maturation nickel metallochaperone HypA [Dehalobacterium sp.]